MPIRVLRKKKHYKKKQFTKDSKYAISFLLRCVELQKIASQKMTSFFPNILKITFSNGGFVWFVAIAYWSKVTTK